MAAMGCMCCVVPRHLLPVVTVLLDDLNENTTLIYKQMVHDEECKMEFKEVGDLKETFPLPRTI